MAFECTERSAGELQSDTLTIIDEVPLGGCDTLTSQGKDVCEAAQINKDQANALVWNVTTCAYDQNVSKCSWINNKCTDSFVMIQTSAPSTPVGTCAYQFINAGECIDGKRKVNVDSTYIPGTCATGSCAVCAGGECYLPCGRSIASLAFFGFTQMLIALAIIGLIYFAMNRIRRK